MAFFDFDPRRGPSRHQIAGGYDRSARLRTRSGRRVLGADSSNSSPSFSGDGSSAPIASRYAPVWDRLEQGSVFEDWVPRDQAGINMMFRRIYFRDMIIGPIVDTMASLPWSSFDIAGVDDPAIRTFYEDAFNFLNPDLLTAMTQDYLVIGRLAGSLLYDSKYGYWKDMIVHDPDLLEINPRPVPGFDPKLDLYTDPGLREFLVSNDERDVRARRVIPDHFLEKLRQSGKIPLDEFNTLYLARKASAYDYVGSSILTRCVSIWAMEKALMDATVTAARRRAGNILHVTAGIEELWEPEPEEMENIASLFVQADEDPVGAVVLTRKGVEANEIRQGGQLWKMGDEWQFLSQAKFYALGVGEAFLAGDATISNMETSRSILIEKISTLRDRITYQTMIKKMATTLARAHGFRKKKQAELDHRIDVKKNKDDEINDKIDSLKRRIKLKNLPISQALDIPENELILPTIHHKKELKPIGDASWLEIMDKMEEKGLPVTLKQWATAAGYDLEAALAGLEEDKKLRARLAAAKSGGGEEGEGEGGNAFASHGRGSPKEVSGIKLWDKNKFLTLSREEALSCFDKVKRYKSELKGAEDYKKLLHSVFPANQEKIEAMSYLLLRMGITSGLEISDDGIKNISRIICDKVNPRYVMKELNLLGKLTSYTRFGPHKKTKIPKKIILDNMGLPDKDTLAGLE